MSNSAINTRKSVYELSEEEIQDLRDAFSKLYQLPVQNQAINTYQYHAGILQSDGHYERNDLLFLPWARAYFFNFEQALQAVSPHLDYTIMLPYWNYTSKTAIKEGLPALFSDQYYERKDSKGSQVVETVPNPLYLAEYILPLQTFREVNEDTSFLKDARKLSKIALHRESFVDFGTSIYIADILSHSYIGGSSENPATTSYDPIFWFTHCQLDHFWWKWQQKHPDGNDSVPNSVKQTTLTPFQLNGEDMKGSDVLNTENLGYTY